MRYILFFLIIITGPDFIFPQSEGHGLQKQFSGPPLLAISRKSGVGIRCYIRRWLHICYDPIIHDDELH